VSSTLTLSGGIEVTIPAGSVSGAGTLDGQLVAAPAPPPRALLPTGSTYRIEVSGTRLVGPAILRFSAQATGSTSAGPTIPVLAYYDTTTKKWTPVPASYQPASNTLTATSTHLSVWSVFRLDASSLSNGMTSIARGFLGIGDHTEQPVSDGQDRLAGVGVSVTSSSGSLLKWSAGITNSATHVKVANNRGYAIGINYPSTWIPTRFGDADDIITALVDFVGGLLTVAPDGKRIIVLAPGKGVEFTVPTGGSGTVTASPNVEAYLLSGLLYGLDTLTMVWDKLPWTSGTEAGKTRKAISLMFASKDCVASFSKLTTEDVSTAHGAGQAFRDAADLATGCLGDAWQVAYGLGAGIASFVAGVFLWLVDGVKLALEGLRAAIDTVLYFGGYNIVVRQAPSSGVNPLLIRFDGIGSVVLGMTASQLQALGYSGSPTSFGCVQYSLPPSNLIYIDMSQASNSVIAANDFQNPAYHTEAGIYLGSTLAELQAAYAGYPIESHMDGSMGQGSSGLIVKGASGYLGFTIDAGVVSGIKVGNTAEHATNSEYSC